MFDINIVCSWLSPFWLHLNFVHNILLSASEIIINDKTGQKIFCLRYVFECLCRLLYYFLIYPFCSLSVAIIITMLTTNTNNIVDLQARNGETQATARQRVWESSYSVQ